MQCNFKKCTSRIWRTPSFPACILLSLIPRTSCTIAYNSLIRVCMLWACFQCKAYMKVVSPLATSHSIFTNSHPFKRVLIALLVFLVLPQPGTSMYGSASSPNPGSFSQQFLKSTQWPGQCSFEHRQHWVLRDISVKDDEQRPLATVALFWSL